MSKDIQRYADVAMFKAEEQPTDGPKVFLLSCNNDPLGSIAAAAKAYVGEFVSSLAEITDEERRYYLTQVQKSALAMPLESVNFHFRITGVTRGFTHQMVRQRTAAYSQESTRFAVKETVPVGLPPSLEGTVPWGQVLRQVFADLYPRENYDDWKAGSVSDRWQSVVQYATEHASPQQLWRKDWDEFVEDCEKTYNRLVNSGMPAEDARGLLPTNLLTQLNYFTNLRNYKDEAGKRLCTQAQSEWRIVFSKMMEAIREYGKTQGYTTKLDDEYGDSYDDRSSAWQFEELADLFRPICYYKGSCQFMADFDRFCTIRDRVEAHASKNEPSTQWFDIQPAEWLLDHNAARIRG